MKILTSQKDLENALSDLTLRPVDYLKLEKFGDLGFNCGCGNVHSLNDEFYAAKIFSAEPDKQLYMCKNSPAITFVQIDQGMLTDEVITLWTAKIDLFQDYGMDIIKKNKSYINVKSQFE